MECGFEQFFHVHLTSFLLLEAQQGETAECEKHLLAAFYVPGTELKTLLVADDRIEQLRKRIFS